MNLGVMNFSFAVYKCYNFIKFFQVHNLILQPGQHSWCEPKQIRQIVTHANCESQVSNQFQFYQTVF